MDTDSESSALTTREVPKINGSAAAFIVLVVVLVIIIIVACSAVVYILRVDMTEDEEALTHGGRARYRMPSSHSGPSSYLKSSKYWLLDVLHSPSSRQRTPQVRSDKPRTVVLGHNHGARGQGWIQTGNDSDFESTDHLPAQKGKDRSAANTKIRTVDYDATSLATPRSSSAGTFPPNHLSRIYSSTSDAASSVRFDPHGVRGLSYGDNSLSAQGIIPSIQSQLYSSPPSSPSLSAMAHGPSRTPFTSSRSIDHSVSNESLDALEGGPFASPSGPRPSVRTFEGGTKFIEGL